VTLIFKHKWAKYEVSERQTDRRIGCGAEVDRQ
jgi:hypothetical protein